MSAPARTEMPKLAAISRYWEDLGYEQLRDIFPTSTALAIGWGEPFCFRCGWLAPGLEAADYPQKWTSERILDTAWNAARGWLERAHLRDHRHGGSSEPDNLVPLCPICHERQPACEDRESGIAFVNGNDDPRILTSLVQSYTDTHYRGKPHRSKKHATRVLLRARAQAGKAIAGGFEEGWL